MVRSLKSGDALSQWLYEGCLSVPSVLSNSRYTARLMRGVGLFGGEENGRDLLL